MAVHRARHIGVGIDRPVEEVYAFLAEPANFPRWAEGLGHSFVPVEGMTWRARRATNRSMMIASVMTEVAMSSQIGQPAA